MVGLMEFGCCLCLLGLDEEGFVMVVEGVFITYRGGGCQEGGGFGGLVGVAGYYGAGIGEIHISAKICLWGDFGVWGVTRLLTNRWC